MQLMLKDSAGLDSEQPEVCSYRFFMARDYFQIIAFRAQARR